MSSTVQNCLDNDILKILWKEKIIVFEEHKKVNSKVKWYSY